MLETFWKIKQYLSYKLFARHRKGHGIHSPFVYQFIRNVLLDRKYNTDFEIIEAYRNELYKLDTELEIHDMGAGSGRLKGSKRKVRNIAQVSSVSKKYGQLLYRMIQYFHSEQILELGTALGISTHYLSLANINANVSTIESNYQLIDVVLKQFNRIGIGNVNILEGNFDDVLPAFLRESKVLDFVFVDGNHSKDATLRYFELLKSKLHHNSIVVFDDIYWSKEMYAAWRKIVSDSFVHVSIDLYRFGIVFFRKELSKQHFIIKY